MFSIDIITIISSIISIEGFGVPETKIWDKLHAISDSDTGTSQKNNHISTNATNNTMPHSSSATDCELIITPTLFGERHCPGQRASVSNITSQNTTLSSVYAALCRGVIDNLHSMMSQDFLLAAGVSRIVGSGTTILKTAALRREIEKSYKLPLILCEGSSADAAVGAALSVDQFFIT